MADTIKIEIKEFESPKVKCATCDNNITGLRAMKFPICDDCLKALRNDIDEQLAGVSRWCVKCRHFEPNEYGAFRYGGHCKFEPPSHYCHNHDATCDKFEALKNEDACRA